MMMVTKETISGRRDYRLMVNKMRVSHAFCCPLIPTYGRNLDVVLATDNVLVLAARRRHAAGVAVVARRTVV